MESLWKVGQWPSVNLYNSSSESHDNCKSNTTLHFCYMWSVVALVRNSKLLASQARKWTAGFKDSEMYEEELLAVSILMKSNCNIDIEPMVYLGSPFPIIQIITLTLHWWPKVSIVNYLRSMVAKFREKGQNLEVSLLSFSTYTFNLLFFNCLQKIWF